MEENVLIITHDRCMSQATRNTDAKVGPVPAVVAGLCIAGGVAAVAGGLGTGMGLGEEDKMEKDE